MIHIRRLNNTWIIVSGARQTAAKIVGFGRCWTGERWSKQPSFAKRFPTRIEAEAELDRHRDELQLALKAFRR